MEQVLVNLLRNALQASPGRAAVSIGLEQGGLIYRVRDFGDGLTADGGEHIFEPFHTTRTRGTGLGLAVARRIVELHGGRLSAANHDEGGAVFSVSIPR